VLNNVFKKNIHNTPCNFVFCTIIAENFKRFMSKKRAAVSLRNLSPELLKIFKERYLHGYQDFVFKVEKPNGDFFHAVTLETEEAIYLVKVPVKIDTKIKDEDEEKDFFGGLADDTIGTEGDEFPEDISDEEPAEEMADE